ncbi:hypothetical protein IVB41_12540 [Bradyrhizobium sp. 44]|uniref:hypothetical protein n=1 Tax=Bradyrhizobium sp. 44 TaxID=2782675 RepID=UPI001FFB2B3D|nr:hypothetical protein [Bradyrhizobium sp. 44]MCK1284744.1 hypothetical protein [Bradyrhizobium sp. 44]
MMRQIIGMFDEYSSRGERQTRPEGRECSSGLLKRFPVPLEYKTVEVDTRGARFKKKLTIDAVEAETVKQIFPCTARARAR